jgi:hypothetical protein
VNGFIMIWLRRRCCFGVPAKKEILEARSRISP